MPIVSALVIENARCFTRARIPFGERVTVLIGGNGAGKTTVSELVGSMADAEPDLAAFPTRRGEVTGRAWLEGADRAVIASVGTDVERLILTQPRLFAYGRYRRVHFGDLEWGRVSRDKRSFVGTDELLGRAWREEAGEMITPEVLERMAFRSPAISMNRPDNHLLRDVARALLALHDRVAEPRVRAAWERFEHALRSMEQHIDGVSVSDRPTGRVLIVKRKGIELELRELSDGYQAILVIVLDLLIRFLHVFPMRSDFWAGPAFVVVDEVDLHLHPRWQRHVVRHLTDTFPGTQFLLTSHAPQVVQGVIDQGGMVVCLDDSDGQSLVTPLSVRATRDLQRASIETVLTDEALFAVPTTFSAGVEAVEERVDDLQAKVEHGQATRREETELLRKLDTLEGIAVDDEARRLNGGFIARTARVQVAFAKKLADLAHRKSEARPSPTNKKRKART